MDRFSDDTRFSDAKTDRDRDRDKDRDWGRTKKKSVDEDYAALGKELLQSAIVMEKSLGELLASEAGRITAMINNSQGCSQTERNKVLNSNESFKKAVSHSSIIEIAVLLKILIAVATIHHDKILAILFLLKDKFDIEDIDYKKIILFFKNQDWNNLTRSVINFVKNNLDIVL